MSLEELSLNKNLKVVLVSPLPPPRGGVATWTYKYIEYCKNNGLQLFHINTAIIGKRADSYSYKVKLLDEVKRALRIWYRIFKCMLNYRPDIAHINTNCSERGIFRDHFSCMIFQFFRLPYIVHCRCNVEDQLKGNKKAIRAFREMCDNSCMVFVQNDFSKDYVESITSARVSFMQNFIESDYILDEKAVREKIEQVVYVGHIRQTKGIEDFLYIAKENKDVRFLLVGPLTDDYKKEDFEGIDNLLLVGEKRPGEIRRILDESDVFVFPTYTEGFSNSLLEAMARGLPIITTNVGANRLMLEDKGGIIVEKGDTTGLVSAFNRIRPYEIRRKMSDYNIKTVKEKFSQEQVMAIMWGRYKEYLETNRCNTMASK